MTGTIILYNVGKGWGFVLPDGGEQLRYFFHISGYCGTGTPREGERVSFELIPPRKQGFRMQAGGITPIAKAETGDKAVL
jgi:cold shock CspA family protein